MKQTAIAPANIAFIKYWGTVDPSSRVPANNSISMNLSEMYTQTTVEFLPEYTSDKITFLGENEVRQKEKDRIANALHRVRKLAKSTLFAKIITRNTFPKATGISSSASGFASLATAAFGALGYPIGEKELSIFCRTLSGGSCRSIPDGFVEWEKGTGPTDSFAHQLYPSNYWNICDVVAVVSKTIKKVSSTDGHAKAYTSPFYESRMKGMDDKVMRLKDAMQKKDFNGFGSILEAEALNMHAICMTSVPPILYWEPPTVAVMRSVQKWREEKQLACYFTIDAGPTVHVICEKANAQTVAQLLRHLLDIQSVVVNNPAPGAHIVSTHLF